MIKQTISNY